MTETTIAFCPRCQTQINRALYSGDFVHQCVGAESLKNEDKLVLGDWTDYTGSDENVHPNVLNAIQPNKLQGTRAGIEGKKDSGRRTSRGFPTSRYRTRQHLQYLDPEFFKSQTEKKPEEPETYT